MLSPMRPRAPSRQLLRYLHDQSEGIAFLEHGSQHKTLYKANGGAAQITSRRGSGSQMQTRCLHTPADVLHSNAKALAPVPLLSRSVSKLRTRVQAAIVPNTTSRSLSSEQKRAAWLAHMWEANQGGKTALKEAERPDCDNEDPESNSMFKRRTDAAKAALEPRIRCTIVNGNGDVEEVDGEYKKSELIARYGLQPRDLRKIDSSNLPHMIVRESAILLNLLHLKVLIKHDRVLLFNRYGSDTTFTQQNFVKDLQERLKQSQVPAEEGGLPYEFRALEAVLMSVSTELENEYQLVQEPVIRLLADLEDDIDRERLRQLLVLSKKLSTFEQKAKLVRNAIEELLDEDDDLSQMYLTEKTHDLKRPEDDHTEVEMLLESYHKICDEVVQGAGNLVTSIRNTEEICRAILDANRNALMLLDLKFSVGTLGLAMGTFLAGLYGMNLENFIESTNWGFAGVTGGSIFFSLLVCRYGIMKLRKVGRVRMPGDEGWGHRRGANRSGYWYEDDNPVAMLEAKQKERLRQVMALKAKQQATMEGAKKWLKPAMKNG